MKKTMLLLAVFVIAFVLVACGNQDNDAENNSNDSKQESLESSANDSSDIKDETNDSEMTPTSTPKPTKKPKRTSTPKPTATPIPSPQYIGNRTVDYDDANSQHRVFWSFSEYNDDSYMAAEAVIHIKIENDNEELLFKKDYEVDKTYYSRWTNSFWDGDRLLGCIYIGDDEIEKGTVESGKLTISADTSGGSFEEYVTEIYDLPLKDVNILIPAVPCEIKEFSYDGTIDKKGEVLDFSIKVNGTHTDGTVSVDYSIKYKMTYNSAGPNKSEYAYVGYKIKDSEGIVVDSSTIMLGELAQGETIKDTGYLDGDLYLGETYTLEFIDVD